MTGTSSRSIGGGGGENVMTAACFENSMKAGVAAACAACALMSAGTFAARGTSAGLAFGAGGASSFTFASASSPRFFAPDFERLRA